MHPHNRERTNTDFFFVKNERALDLLPAFLAQRPFNRYNPDLRDRKEQPMIALTFRHPDGTREKRGLICCANESLRDAARAVVDKHQQKPAAAGNEAA